MLMLKGWMRVRVMPSFVHCLRCWSFSEFSQHPVYDVDLLCLHHLHPRSDGCMFSLQLRPRRSSASSSYHMKLMAYVRKHAVSANLKRTLVLINATTTTTTIRTMLFLLHSLICF
jgi:hypothetical protein